MAKQRYIKTDLWADPYFEEMDSSEKLLYIYLLTNELVDLCGVYKISTRRMSNDTGFNKNQVELILERFSRDDVVHYVDNYICVTNFLEYQNTGNDKIMSGIQRSLEKIPENTILSIASISKGFISHIGPMHKSSHLTLPYLTLPNYTKPNLTEKSEEDKPKGSSKKDIANTPEEILTHWNEKKIIAHKKLDSKGKAKLKIVLKEYDVDEIKKAIDNYSGVFHSDKTYWSHKRTLTEFLYRGIDTFLHKGVDDYLSNSKSESVAILPTDNQGWFKLYDTSPGKIFEKYGQEVYMIVKEQQRIAPGRCIIPQEGRVIDITAVLSSKGLL